MKKLTILHSNDLHGDFLAAEADSALVGGVSMLSGYISKVRREEKNGQPSQIATSAANVLEEYLTSHDFSRLELEPRLVIH